MSRLRAIWLAYLRAGTSVATRKLTKPSQDGLVAIGAVTATLGDGSAVTNCWYRFADQPALLNADLTKEEPEAMQVRVEKLHRACTKDREYLAPPTVGTLAYLDPAQLVQPPKGFEVGYVPIAVRQESAARGTKQKCSIPASRTIRGIDDQRDEAGDPPVRLDGVPQRELRVHPVAIAPTQALPLDVTTGLEVGHDALHGALRDADVAGDVLQQDLRVLRDQQQHVRVVAQECPSVPLVRGRRRLAAP